MLYIIVHYTL